MTEEDEQVKKFIDFLDDDNALDKILGIVKKTNKFLKNEIAELKKETERLSAVDKTNELLLKHQNSLKKEVHDLRRENKELRCCGNCQSVFDADGFCYLYKDGRCINQSEWTKRSNKKSN